MSAPLEIFCCYAHEDQELLEHLKKHLMPLQRRGQITVWSDTNLNAGVEWEKELRRHLESADLILLLISPDFMDSDYCYSTEMERAIERHDQGSAVVIPILLRPTLWRDAPFAKLQILPRDAKPVRDRGWFDSDEAFHTITEQINGFISELQTRYALRKAEEYHRLNNYAEALVHYEQALHLTPQNGQALFGRAGAFYQLGQIDASIDAFALATQITPTDGNVYFSFLQADALTQRKRYAESLTVYDQALRFDSCNAEIHAERAHILIQLEEYEKALSAFEQAQRLEPEKAEYYVQTGELLFRLRRFEQALIMYKQASKKQPDEAKHIEQQGQILVQLRRYEEALIAYQQALVIMPQTHYYEQAANICLQLVRPWEALEMYKQAIQTTTEQLPSLYAGEGQAFIQLERYNEALACYQKAITLSTPDTDPQFYHNLGVLYERLAKSAYKMEQQQRITWQSATQHNPVFAPGFNPAKLMLLQTLNVHKHMVTCMAISPDGAILASGGVDETIKLWELPSGRELHTLTNLKGITSIAISPDGAILACAVDKTIKLWELPSGRELPTLINQKRVISIAISPDGAILASGSVDETIKLWELPSGSELPTFVDDSTGYNQIAISPDGCILVGSKGGLFSAANLLIQNNLPIIRVWELPSRRELPTFFNRSYNSNPYHIVISPDGTILVGGGGETIDIWELPTGRKLHTLTNLKGITSIAISPDGAILACGIYDTIKFWELPSGHELHTLTADKYLNIEKVIFSYDGTILISSHRGGKIMLWRIEQ